MPEPILIFYDRQCPICRYAVQDKLSAINPAIEELIDVRTEDQRVRDLWNSGVDLNSGFCVVLEGQRFVGARGLNVLALHTQGEHFFHTVGLWMLRRRMVCVIVYPCLVALRYLLLRLLNIPRVPRL